MSRVPASVAEGGLPETEAIMSNAPPLWPEQREDIQAVLQNPAFALLNRVGSGKTRVVIEVSAELFRRGEIDTVVCITPASVRSVWVNPDPVLGELSKWIGSTGVPTTIREYHAKTARSALADSPGALLYVVTNFDFVRRLDRLVPLGKWLRTRKPMLVVEESWAIRNWSSQQTKAIRALRKVCPRIVFLNGTGGEPHHLFSMFSIMDPAILGVSSFYSFKNRFARLGGFQGKEIVGYSPEQKAEFERRTKPYAVARTEATWTAEDPVRTTLEVKLTPATWKLYTSMEADAVARLGAETSVATHGGIVILRLMQLTAGILGGVQESLTSPALDTRDVSREKLDALVEDLDRDPADKIVVFCQFRREIARVQEVLRDRFPGLSVVALWGGQTPVEREDAKRLLAPGGDPRPAAAIVHPASGGAGLNLAQAARAYFLTNGYSSRTRKQAEGRIDRPGQTRRPRFVDVLATGPNGEPTIDHVIAAALRRAEAVESWTAQIWSAKLRDQVNARR